MIINLVDNILHMLHTYKSAQDNLKQTLGIYASVIMQVLLSFNLHLGKKKSNKYIFCLETLFKFIYLRFISVMLKVNTCHLSNLIDDDLIPY